MKSHDKKRKIQMQYRKQIQLKKEVENHTNYIELADKKKEIQEKYREKVQQGRKSKKGTIEVIIVAITCIILMMGYLFFSISETKKDSKVKQDAWKQLSYEQKDEIVRGWENARVDEVILTKDMMSSIKDKSYLNQKVYLVSYTLKHHSVFLDVYVEKKHNKIIGDRLRGVKKVIIIKEDSFFR